MSATDSRRRSGSTKRAVAGAVALASLAACLVPAAPRAPAPTPVRLPLMFLPNVGQAPAAVKYMVRTGPMVLGFERNGMQLGADGGVVRVTFAGASPLAGPEALAARSGKVNLLVGQPEDWKTNVATFEGVVYRDLYPGIDLFYKAEAGDLKSEFLVQPGGNPGQIRFSYSGIRRLRIDRGALLLETDWGEIREQAPSIYQEAGGRRLTVEGGFTALGGNETGFRLGAYDRSLPLIIDPLLSYSTYLGGSGLDSIKAITVDGSGNAYVAGQTDSTNFPTAAPLRSQSGGGVDAFVAKLNAAGSLLVYCTYLGGSWDDRAFGLAVDSGGNAYVTGWTYSSNFPTTPGARQRTLGGGRDAFVAKLNPAGNSLSYSTYLGGSGYDSGNAIAVDGSGSAHVAGETTSSNFPVAGGFRLSNQGRQDAFAAKLNSAGSGLLWSTYLGGSGDDRATALAVDASGNVCLTGSTDSANFPTLNPFQPSIGGGQDAFVTKLNAGGATLGFSTFLGGNGGAAGSVETGAGIKFDSFGNIYVAGSTSSTNFPLSSPIQPAHAGGMIDAFVSKLNPTGSALVYGTYLGGASLDYALGLGVDSAGRAWLTGYTSSTNFPTANALQAVKSGGYDLFLTRLNAAGTALEASTYLGGDANDVANGLALDSSGAAYLAGQTLSTDIAVSNPVQALNPGGLSGWVVKISERVPTGVFRSTTGATYLNLFGSSTLYSAAGWLTSDLSASRNTTGDTFVIGRNDTTTVWLNIFDNASRSWRGWLAAGANLYGSPAVAVTANGDAHMVARDAGSNYWLNTYRTVGGFLSWTMLASSPTSDPAMATLSDGSVIVAGSTSSGSLLAGRYVPGAGFQGWVPATGAPVVSGKPAICAGSDGAVYVAVRAADKTLWMSRFTGTAWGTWYSAGGSLGTEPDVAASQGVVFVSVTSQSNGVYLQRFAEGTGNGWLGWIWTNGYLQKASVASIEGRYYVFGRDLQNGLWWYDSVAGWTSLGYVGLAGGHPAASPK